MRIVGILGVFAIAVFALSSAVLAAPLPLEFTFGGSGSGGGYTATVDGTGTIDPAAQMVAIAGTVVLTAPDGSVLVQQEFGHTADWSARGTFPLTIELQPVDGLSITVTVTPGEPAEVTIVGP